MGLRGGGVRVDWRRLYKEELHGVYLKERDQVKDLGVRGRVILKLILKKHNGMV